ncbi:anaerobic ribonucleoside-triphosphate reductase activating protein [Candidatus Methylacidiphilum infernorum]|uniref:Ribonucleotide reductase of class III (Anaerobic), activating protein n=1 Tax=Methylacidiphilum infernorum (isolate V4) TaxID=481448 RepID=B3E034_METI4|nr:anaerobic ribonucleoside-triphosphate reductase activating protein [Candidatus Methylacidiphilum infernorum]ACD82695.1 Ribonucleotide reductase of class III (anaerobic), activating protein [Methylacidiphilum infernorum V4]
MKIGGIEPFSLIDFPEKTAAVIFTQGCNFRCPYCYVPQLVVPENYGPLLPLAGVLEFLDSRKEKIEGVVITGGEPTLQEDLQDFIILVKKRGFLVKLDTNGSHPEILERLIQKRLIDFVAMDFKAPLEKYPQATSSSIDPSAIAQSLDLLLQGKIEYEFRTTVVKEDLSFDEFKVMVAQIGGAQKYVLQKFLPLGPLVDSSYQRKHPLELEEAQRWKNYALLQIKKVILRNY